jgi:hypothetical protein
VEKSSGLVQVGKSISTGQEESLMRIVGRFVAVLLTVVVGLGVATSAGAQITGSTGTNVQTGDNRARTNQSGTDASGPAVGGQVTGVVANGRTSVDASNTSSNSSVQSGDAAGTNSSSSFTGLNAQTGSGTVNNFQDGNNTFTLTQTADATSGDGVNGQIIGAVTEAGGSASIVAKNTSDNNDVITGDSTFSNTNDSFVGLNASPTAVGEGPAATANNTQFGNNRLTVSEVASSATGNGVAGQIVGVVSAGTASVDATNSSTNNDVDTVDTASDNASTAFVGLDAEPFASDSAIATATNIQNGDNRGRINQFAPGTANSSNAFVGLDADPSAIGPPQGARAATATATNNQDGRNVFTLDQTAPVSTANVDSVAGQVIGAVTAAGGSASLVAANTSDNNSVQNVGVAGQVMGVVSAGATSVDATNNSSNNDVFGGVTAGSNASDAFVGLDADPSAAGGAPILAAATNTQIGDNRGTISQSSSVTGGEPVAGQIIGVVTGAGGSTSLVAANTSSNNDVTTGSADAPNTSFAFVGLDADPDPTAGTADSGTNFQDGNNRFTLAETSSATSGNGVAGQILGVVSSGATSLDATNRSDDNSVVTGDALATNNVSAFVGLSFAPTLTVTTGVIASDINGVNADNIQDGNNRKTLSQAAEATSGDAIAGEVSGVVTSAGATASVVLANTSTGMDVRSGDALFDNTDNGFVGLTVLSGPLNIG